MAVYFTADFDVARVEHLRRLKKIATDRVRPAAALTGGKPVAQHLYLDVDNPTVLQHRSKGPQAHLAACSGQICVDDAKSTVARARRRLDA
jgi:hypothetical protein